MAHIELILVCMPSDMALAAEAEAGEESMMAERRALVLQTLAGVAAAAAWQDHAAFDSPSATDPQRLSAVSTAAACLADDAAATRAAALAALAAFGPRASAAHVDAIAALLEDEDAPVRLHVESRRPEASGQGFFAPPSFDTPRQRQSKRRAASSLSRPRPTGK